MGSLIGELGRALTDTRTVTLTPKQEAELLVQRHGSGRKAAKAIGIAESTFRGWRHGVRPRGFHQQTLTVSTRRSSRFRSVRSGEVEIVIRAEVRVSTDTRTRNLHIGRWIPLTDLQHTLDLWADNRDVEAQEDLVNSIDIHYQPMEWINVERVWFE